MTKRQQKNKQKRKEACPTGKVPYDTIEGARFFAHAENMRAYPCPLCQKYHLTMQPFKPKRQ